MYMGVPIYTLDIIKAIKTETCNKNPIQVLDASTPTLSMACYINLKYMETTYLTQHAW